MAIDLQAAIDLIIHDFRRPGVLPDLTIQVSKWPVRPPAFLGDSGPIGRPRPPRAGSVPAGFGEEDEVVVICSEEKRFASLIHIPDLMPQNPLLLRIADAAHLAVLEDRWGGVFPQCPVHPAHPLSPQLRNDGIFWECPNGGIEPIPLGSLPDHFV